MKTSQSQTIRDALTAIKAGTMFTFIVPNSARTNVYPLARKCGVKVKITSGLVGVKGVMIHRADLGW